MAGSTSAVDLLGSSLHVWPDFHGNRSPLADPTLKGMVSQDQSKLCGPSHLDLLFGLNSSTTQQKQTFRSFSS